MSLALLAPGAARADCPDGEYLCGNGRKVKYGMCYRFPSCQPCSSDWKKTAKKKCEKYEPSCKPSLSSRTDGCSNPLKDPTTEAYKEIFRKACDAHDFCYSTPGAEKDNCDKMFKEKMLATCEDHRHGKGKSRAGCGIVAESWFQAVSLSSESKDAYENGQKWAKKHCKD